MAHGTTAIVSSILALLVFASMMAFRSQLAELRSTTILGGFLGSNVFVFLLTAVSNFEMDVIGETFQSKIFPEISLCLLISMIASSFVHRVCVTTCVVFSLVFLYVLNRIAANKYQTHAAVAVQQAPVKKRK